MPIKENAKKALRQAKKRTIKNHAVKDAYKKAVKATIKAADEKKDEAKTLVIAAQKTLSKAAKANVMHPRTAARKISRLMKKVNKSLTK